MASTGGDGHLDSGPLILRLKSAMIVNRILQDILTAEGLSRTGVKAELQQRIIDRVKQHAAGGDKVRFDRLKEMIENPHSVLQAATNKSPGPGAPRAYFSGPPARPSQHNMGGGIINYKGFGYQSLSFKPSPFYNFEQQLGEPKECAEMKAHRNSTGIVVRLLDHPILQRLALDPSLKVMVFCAGEAHGRQDISFPHQSELKVNGGEIKANLRGLKNKPGSTRPVDITKELRLKSSTPAYENNVELLYALTNKKFYLILSVVKMVPVSDLVKKLENGRRISRESIVSEMVNKSRDADIVATASVLSLKCPLSTLRISLPCRSIACRHNQCFDATSYLQLQEQGPTWSCPICNNPAPFENLAVDDYVKDILKNTSRSVDQVTIHPNGTWDQNQQQEPMHKFNRAASDDDEDLVEITKPGINVGRGTPQIHRTPARDAPPVSNRETSTAASSMAGSGSVSGKRPRAVVIDLTSSGDEDDEPLVRAPKRQLTNGYTGTANVPVYRPAPSNGYPPPR